MFGILLARCEAFKLCLVVIVLLLAVQQAKKHQISLFRIPVVSAHESEHTSSIKKEAREKWLEVIFRTREITPEVKKRMANNNNIYVCERHFKDECISKGE